MPKTKHKIKYSNVKIPANIVGGIDELIEKNSHIFRYRSPADFIIAVVRIRLEEFEKRIEKEKKVVK